MRVIKEKPAIIENTHNFCAGCSHGTFYRLIQECVEELGYADYSLRRRLQLQSVSVWY